MTSQINNQNKSLHPDKEILKYFCTDQGPMTNILEFLLNGALILSKKLNISLKYLKKREIEKIKKHEIIQLVFKKDIEKNDLPKIIYQKIQKIIPLKNILLEYEGGAYSIASEKIIDALNILSIVNKIFHETVNPQKKLQDNYALMLKKLHNIDTEKTIIQSLEDDFKIKLPENLKTKITDITKNIEKAPIHTSLLYKNIDEFLKSKKKLYENLPLLTELSHEFYKFFKYDSFKTKEKIKNITISIAKKYDLKNFITSTLDCIKFLNNLKGKSKDEKQKISKEYYFEILEDFSKKTAFL